MQILTRNWWILALRGLFALLFGIMALIWPDVTLDVLVMLFGAYLLVDGAFTIVALVTQRGGATNWVIPLLEGILGIVAGIATFVWPGLTQIVLLYLIAAWAIVTGILEIIAAVQLRREIEGEFLLGLVGALSLIFGVLLIVWPGPGALAVVWMIGIYAILFGILLIALGLRLRSWEGTRATAI